MGTHPIFESDFDCLTVDQVGTCERHICECDKKFAEGMRKQAETFNMLFDRFWGGFDQKEECQASVGTPPWDECCGLYPERQPYASKGGKGCCQDKIFDTAMNQCCEDKLISYAQTCSAN